MKKADISVEKLGQLTVLDQDRNRVKLSELWTDNTAVIVFVRHFG